MYLAEEANNEVENRKLVPNQPEQKTTIGLSSVSEGKLDQDMTECHPPALGESSPSTARRRSRLESVVTRQKEAHLGRGHDGLHAGPHDLVYFGSMAEGKEEWGLDCLTAWVVPSLALRGDGEVATSWSVEWVVAWVYIFAHEFGLRRFSCFLNCVENYWPRRFSTLLHLLVIDTSLFDKGTFRCLHMLQAVHLDTRCFAYGRGWSLEWTTDGRGCRCIVVVVISEIYLLKIFLDKSMSSSSRTENQASKNKFSSTWRCVGCSFHGDINVGFHGCRLKVNAVTRHANEQTPDDTLEQSGFVFCSCSSSFRQNKHWVCSASFACHRLLTRSTWKIRCVQIWQASNFHT